MRIGLACRNITPPFRTTMGGYGARQDHFDGVHDPLTFTAIVIEEGPRRALIGAADLIGFTDYASPPSLHKRLARIVGCPEENVLLNASHTHGGPHIVDRSIFDSFTQDIESAKRYKAWLFDQVAEAAHEAAGSLFEGTLWFAEGKTGFPMNRRLERNGEVVNAPRPDGPIDGRMQTLTIRNKAGEIAAIGMRLSCHPVATGAQHLITADFVGAWRAEMSRAFGPKVIPFFLQGSGADTRPRHAANGDRWRELNHAELEPIGRELLAESLAILTSGKQLQISDLILQGKINTVCAPCRKRYTQAAQLKPLLQSDNRYERLYAQECLRLIESGKEVPDHADLHVQTLWLSREFALIGLNVEPLLALGAYVESAIAPPRRAILLGYTNGALCYAPDSAEMKRGGYETTSYLFQPWTGPLLPGLEKLLAEAVVAVPGRQSPASGTGSRRIGARAAKPRRTQRRA